MKQIFLLPIIFLQTQNAIGQRQDSSEYNRIKTWKDSVAQEYKNKNELLCNNQKINVNVFVKGSSYQKTNSISKYSLVNGFELELSDTSFKIEGFKIFYEFSTDPFGDKIIMGKKITTQNLPFLTDLRKFRDGYFEFSCISIEKNGKKYNANNFHLLLLDK